MGEFFNQHAGYQGLHEPQPSRILRMWSIAHFEGVVSNHYLRAALFAKRRRLYNPDDSRVYVESNPYLIGFADVLGDVFASPTIIHIVRDPRDYVKSAINHGNDRGIKLLLNSYLPFWYANVEHILGLPYKLPMRLRTAAYWSIANKALIDFGKRHPENYYMFRYEDVFDGEQKDMKKLLGILNLSSQDIKQSNVSKKGRNQSRLSSVQSWNTWSNEDCRIVNDLCDPLMTELGYGLEPEWKRKLKDAG